MQFSAVCSEVQCVVKCSAAVCTCIGAEVEVAAVAAGHTAALPLLGRGDDHLGTGL